MNGKLSESSTFLKPNVQKKFLISEQEYDALFDIRGLEQSAHLMVMTASRNSTDHYVLEGTSSAFDALAFDIAEELEFRTLSTGQTKMSSKTIPSTLARIPIFFKAQEPPLCPDTNPKSRESKSISRNQQIRI
jgi:hypothetical protein